MKFLFYLLFLFSSCFRSNHWGRWELANVSLKLESEQKLNSKFNWYIIHTSLQFTFFTGGCCGSTKKRTIVGGWAWAWWLVTDVQRLSLEVMTLNPMCENVETAQGVPLTVTGVAQCKIMKVCWREIIHRSL